jgi:hypothetical protein
VSLISCPNVDVVPLLLGNYTVFVAVLLLVEVNVKLQEESMNITDLCDVTHGVL